MIVKIKVRENRYDDSYVAEVSNINAYIKHVSGKAVGRGEHHMRYEYGESQQDAVNNLVARLKSEDNYSGKWQVIS